MTLDNNKTDRVVTLAKIASNLLPGAGSLVVDLISELIPAQRIDRITDYVQRLEGKIEKLSEELRKERVRRDVDLIEAGMWHATRAPTEVRRERLACVVADSLNQEDVDFLRQKTLLDLLAELNDNELILLQMYGLGFGPDADAFRQKHQDVLMVMPAHLGGTSEDVDKETMHRAYKEHLARLSLVSPRFKNLRKGELPEFDDKTGTMKSQGYEVTWLGRMVLDAAGLPDNLRARRRAAEAGTKGAGADAGLE